MMVICVMPECQTTAGCQCGRSRLSGEEQMYMDGHNAGRQASIREAEERTRRETIEECAKVAEDFGKGVNRGPAGDYYTRKAAAAIRSLSVQTKGEPE